MGLIGDLSNDDLFRTRMGLACTVCVFMESLTPEEHTLFTARMADPKIHSTTISRVLAANGIEIKDGVLGRHRRGECRGARR